MTPGGAACRYNDIIPADHCLHDVQDMSTLNHPRADLSKGQYGCVGQGLHIAKKLLPYIPNNAGILLVPCCRGGSAFTQGAEGTFSESTGGQSGFGTLGGGQAVISGSDFPHKRRHCRKIPKTFCWPSAGCRVSLT
ncbi:putative 9-O-acetyl-N-acetylneuraminate esterase [Escherichia coli DEC8C]|nr:putative 9-O-acetyl-N-acetylneuraminate esterase [Escherichia coli DEC8C]